jgi:hypothetical protein
MSGVETQNDARTDTGPAHPSTAEAFGAQRNLFREGRPLFVGECERGHRFVKPRPTTG